MSLLSEIRLNKFISDSGHCSRREADKLIESNRVKLNGKLPELGSKVGSDDVVTVDGQQIYSSAPNKSDRAYLAYNKPIGITCTTEKNVDGNIVDAVDYDERVFPIGRLDKPSEGLILLTNDGDIVNKILRAENSHDKEYIVTVNKPIGKGFSEKMSGGVPILNTVTKPCSVSIENRTTFRIVLTQGLNRQIRRMCDYLGYDVVSLKRTRIMNVSLGKLRPGQWRKLTREELAALNAAVSESSSESATKSKSGSSKTHSKSKPKSKVKNGFTPRGSSGSKSRPNTSNKKTEGSGGRGSGKGSSGEGKDKPSGGRHKAGAGGKNTSSGRGAPSKPSRRSAKNNPGRSRRK